MARLDVFVCDKCDKRVNNSGPGAGVEDWVIATFPYVFPNGRDLNNISAPKNMLLCPRCVREVHEPYPKAAPAE